MTLEPISLNLPGENEYFTQEAYKTLRTNIQFCGHDIKVIAITASKVKSSSASIGSGVGNNNQVAQAEIAKNLEEVADVEW